MRDVLDALLRRDLRSFIHKAFYTVFPGTAYLPNWHIDAIVYQLLRLMSGRGGRLLINQPPRSLKSLSVSVAFVAWLWVTIQISASSWSATPTTLPPSCIDSSEC